MSVKNQYLSPDIAGAVSALVLQICFNRDLGRPAAPAVRVHRRLEPARPRTRGALGPAAATDELRNAARGRARRRRAVSADAADGRVPQIRPSPPLHRMPTSS